MLTIEIISINEGMPSMVHPIIVWHFRVVHDEKGNPVFDYISSIDSLIPVNLMRIKLMSVAKIVIILQLITILIKNLSRFLQWAKSFIV